MRHCGGGQGDHDGAEHGVYPFPLYREVSGWEGEEGRAEAREASRAWTEKGDGLTRSGVHAGAKEEATAGRPEEVSLRIRKLAQSWMKTRSTFGAHSFIQQTLRAAHHCQALTQFLPQRVLGLGRALTGPHSEGAGYDGEALSGAFRPRARPGEEVTFESGDR